MDGPLYALACAIDGVGDVEHLATRLNVPRGDVAKWLAGLEAPPLAVVMDALDLIG